MESRSDKIDLALKKFDGDYDTERTTFLVRIDLLA